MTTKKINECIERLKDKKWTIAFAEGATNGKICKEFACYPDAAVILVGGMVAVQDHMKDYFFGIQQDSITQFGSESAEVSKMMAHHLGQYLQSDIAISLTMPSRSNKTYNLKHNAKVFIHFLFPNLEFYDSLELIGTEAQVTQKVAAKIAEVIIAQIGATDMNIFLKAT